MNTKELVKKLREISAVLRGKDKHSLITAKNSAAWAWRKLDALITRIEAEPLWTAEAMQEALEVRAGE